MQYAEKGCIMISEYTHIDIMHDMVYYKRN